MTITARKTFLVLAFSLLVLPLAHADGTAEDDKMTEEYKKYQFETITTKEGLRFAVPPDMPIQRKDGLVQPVEFNQYLYVKLKMLEERMTKLETQIEDMQKKLLSKMDELKAQEAENFKKLSAPASTPAGLQTAS